MARSSDQQDDAPVRVVLGGTAVDVCSADDVYTAVRNAMVAPTGEPLLIGSVNLDHLHHFGPRADPQLREIGSASRWLMLVDGVPIAVAARGAATRPAPRLAGSDLLPEFLELAVAQRIRVGFLGGAPEVREALAAVMSEQFPDVTVTGHWTPAREELEDPAATARLLADIRATRTDMLVVGLGKPRQELWLHRHAETAGVRVGLAFGASADFLAGQVERAPEWFRRNGLEWAYRLALEPRRMARRYLVQGPVALVRMQLGGTGPAPVPVPALGRALAPVAGVDAAVDAGAMVEPSAGALTEPVADPDPASDDLARGGA